MYEEHYGFHQAPFSLTPNTALFYCVIPHYEAIQMLLSALGMGEGIMKVTGEVGTGKTLVCRMLINHLPDNFELVYFPNPVMTGHELRQAMAKELGLDTSGDNIAITDRIHEKLIALQSMGKSVAVFIDEAQALSDEALETIRLFGNLETDQTKLLQVVLFGQPELDLRLAEYHMRQLRQRITFSASLRELNCDETTAYIEERLKLSGCSFDIFDLAATKAIWKASNGTPRIINQICHKALLLAYQEKRATVNEADLYAAIHDTSDTRKPKFRFPMLWGWS
ncbi:AAA family ATPase [Vibrio sp. Of7-15]|uniref:ExeA family protein n=1 Tax=Vibrio sp. Of7-15 TaxID=2724879 RepID=UPI001EF263E6|nr:AAA family ATPase [Vibrio sp. Of7-15]MCG7498525.1 AAA family ATPase [Vibrio sp. Of7-15]